MEFGRMISFKQFLGEIFDKPLSYSSEKKNEKMTSYEFTDSGILYKISIHQERLTGTSINEYEISLYANGTTDLTQKNNAIKVYSTLIKIVKDHFKHSAQLKSGDVVYMISANPRTGQIYKKFAMEFAKMYGGTAKRILTSEGSYKVTIK